MSRVELCTPLSLEGSDKIDIVEDMQHYASPENADLI